MTNKVNRRSFVAASILASAKGLWAADVNGTSEPVVDTASGKLRGRNLGKVMSFRGVPYGASTEGSGRFMPPQKVQPWTGVRDALELGPASPQFPSNLIPEAMAMQPKTDGAGNEDCLRLNVWTPSSSGKRPVMVWLHGGGFSAGSSNWVLYDGANLASTHDVVVVSITHRLNVFGYLYVADLGGEKYKLASNAGQLDIIQALQWVHDNISRFGGDAGNVTIFGQSGGGGKVATLLGMSGAKGLFHRAIAQSGSLLKGTPRDRASKGAEALMAKLNLKPNQVDELQRVPQAQLLQAMRAVQGLPLNPVTDGHTLPEDPFDPVATSISAGIPLMIGSTETEVTWSVNTDYTPLDDAALQNRVKDSLKLDDAAASKLISVYKTGRPKASNLDLFLIVSTDFSNFRTGTDTIADRKSALNKAPVYKYYFQWYSPVREGKPRSYHTLDIPFVLENHDIATPMTGSGPERQALADKMSGAWVAFAKSGNPNHKGLPKWDRFDEKTRATMIFNNECRAVNDPFKEERLAWIASKA